MVSKQIVHLTVTGLLAWLSMSCAPLPTDEPDTLPPFMMGAFEDDYGVQYHIDNKVFQMLPNDQFYILRVNQEAGFIILQNDSLNSFAPSLFTRIDYQRLTQMAPYEWAFCFSSFEAVSVAHAIDSVNTQKTDLMKGCNGYPFSRMKRSTQSQETTSDH